MQRISARTNNRLRRKEIMSLSLKSQLLHATPHHTLNNRLAILQDNLSNLLLEPLHKGSSIMTTPTTNINKQNFTIFTSLEPIHQPLSNRIKTLIIPILLTSPVSRHKRVEMP